MQKHEDVVQNLNGNVVVNATIQVMVAFTSTPATIYSDPAGQVPIDLLRTDSLGEFSFYAPNGRYDIFAIINGNRVAHNSDIILYDPEDDERVTSGSATSSSGNGMTPEVELAVANNTLTPDFSLGNNFHVLLTNNTRFVNPVGYPEGVDITIVVEQDSVGARIASYDTQYGMPDSQPIQLATAPYAINKLTLHRTKGQLWLVDCAPDKTYQYGYGLVTALARIGQVNYFAMGTPLGSTVPGAMPNIHNGQTIVVVRNGKGPEATGSITGLDGEIYSIVGAPVGNPGDADRRPQLLLMHDTRPSFNKAIINLEGKGTTYVRDIRLSGARGTENDARGICPNADAMNLVLNNVEITDCCNGILSGNQGMTGNIDMHDVLIDKCGIGGPNPYAEHNYTTVGFTHSVYFGHNNATITMERCTLQNAIDGNNLKCRTGRLILNQVLCVGSANGRELEMSNGGWLDATNCTFWKNTSGGTGNLALVGGNGGAANTVEGTDTSRPRKYRFTNCRFQNDQAGGSGGHDVIFICSLDPNVPMEFIDCEFIGDGAKASTGDPNNTALYAGTVTVNGVRYYPSMPPIYTLTGGPIGPLPSKPPGYQLIPMTDLVA